MTGRIGMTKLMKHFDDGQSEGVEDKSFKRKKMHEGCNKLFPLPNCEKQSNRANRANDGPGYFFEHKAQIRRSCG